MPSPGEAASASAAQGSGPLALKFNHRLHGSEVIINQGLGW